MKSRKVVGWSLAVPVGFPALVGTAASATFCLREPADLDFLEIPAIVKLHVVPGGDYPIFAPFQFVTRIRSDRLDYHRPRQSISVPAA